MGGGGGRGGRRDFAGAMKYFRQMLMDHEIYLRIFDRPQTMFLCTFLFFFFFFFFFLITSSETLWTSEHKMFKHFQKQGIFKQGIFK